MGGNCCEQVSEILKDGGTLSVAHGQSREQIDANHKKHASKVSMRLMQEDKLEELFEKYLEVIVKVPDESIYQVIGKK